MHGSALIFSNQELSLSAPLAGKKHPLANRLEA